MRKRWLFGIVVGLLVAGGILFLCLRGPAEEPRYPRVEIGMQWDQAEQILGKAPFQTTYDGMLHKSYTDVDGRVRLSFDAEGVVRQVKYIPDNPDPTAFQRLAKWLRL